MDYYHKFAAICCLMAVLNVYGTDGEVTVWASVVAATPADTAVTTALVSATASADATGTAGITFRDGVSDGDNPLFTVQATADNTEAYTLDTPSQTNFAIVSGTGVFSMKAGVTLSHAAQSTYTVLVTATDSDGTGVLTLSVTLNAPPTFPARPICLNIADETGAGITLYTFATADPEGTTVTTTITAGNDDGYFEASLVDGKLVTALAIDKATLELFTLTIQAEDAGPPPSAAATTFVVPVLDAGTGMGTCSSSGGTVVIGSVMTTMALLVTYFL